MKSVLQPWQFLLLILAGWINRHQQEVLEYLHAENQVLKEKLGKKRILLTDEQRRRLAIKGKVLGRKALQEISTIVSPDTIPPSCRGLQPQLPTRCTGMYPAQSLAGRPTMLLSCTRGDGTTWI